MRYTLPWIALLALAAASCTTSFKGPLGGTFTLGYQPPASLHLDPAPLTPEMQAPAPNPPTAPPAKTDPTSPAPKGTTMRIPIDRSAPEMLAGARDAVATYAETLTQTHAAAKAAGAPLEQLEMIEQASMQAGLIAAYLGGLADEAAKEVQRATVNPGVVWLLTRT